MLLRDKVAIVTGAASLVGIGWATANLFAEHGAKVVLLDLDEALITRAAARIGSAHLGLVCDVRDPDACGAAVATSIERYGTVDIVINNAGVSQPQGLMESTMADYDLVMDVSMRGAYNMTRAVTPHFRKRGAGAIVCMGSLAAQRGGGVLGGPHYAAAKGAVHAFTKAVARELGPDGIRVNAIAPGLTDTNLLAGKIDEDGKNRISELTPLRRLAKPLDVANTCLYLASDLSIYVTGCILDVNGGFHIH